MRISTAVPEAYVSKPILDASLEAVTRLNESLLKSGAVPKFRDAVERVRWKPEPPGQEHFDHAAKVLGRGWGDCDDLAPWHAASLRVTGEDRGALAVVKKSGPKRWHAVVRRSDGSIDDPSREAGMGSGGARGVNGAVLPVMGVGVHGVGAHIQRPHLALRPLRDRAGQVEAWQARADLPWHWQPGNSPGDVAMAALNASPISSQAIVGACRGAMRLGAESGFVSDDVLDHAEAVAEACDGADWEDLARAYGPDVADAAMQSVVGFFGGIKRAVRRVATPALRMATGPLSRTALSFVPGVGPLASQALSMASPHLQRMVSRGGTAPRGAAAVAPMRRPAGQRLYCVPA